MMLRHDDIRVDRNVEFISFCGYKLVSISVTHIPTGTTATSDQRGRNDHIPTEHAMKAQAMRRLRDLLQE